MGGTFNNPNIGRDLNYTEINNPPSSPQPQPPETTVMVIPRGAAVIAANKAKNSITANGLAAGAGAAGSDNQDVSVTVLPEDVGWINGVAYKYRMQEW